MLASTDLVSGQPLYFARDFVYSPPYGWGEPGDLSTAAALYSSAAFPVAFPPKRLGVRRFQFQDGWGTPPFPRSFRLSDGGVYNNLGTDWFESVNDQRNALWPFGERSLDIPEIQRLIVVNAGAQSRPLRRLFPVPGIIRTMSCCTTTPCALGSTQFTRRVPGVRSHQC